MLLFVFILKIFNQDMLNILNVFLDLHFCKIYLYLLKTNNILFNIECELLENLSLIKQPNNDNKDKSNLETTRELFQKLESSYCENIKLLKIKIPNNSDEFLDFTNDFNESVRSLNLTIQQYNINNENGLQFLENNIRNFLNNFNEKITLEIFNDETTRITSILNGLKQLIK